MNRRWRAVQMAAFVWTASILFATVACAIDLLWWTRGGGGHGPWCVLYCTHEWEDTDDELGDHPTDTGDGEQHAREGK